MTSEEFEEYVRRECLNILRALHHQQYDDAIDRAEGLSQLTADRIEQRRGREESASSRLNNTATMPPSTGNADAGIESRDRSVKRLRKIALITNPKDPNNHYFEYLFSNHPPVETPADVRCEVINCEGLPQTGTGDYIQATYTDGSRDLIPLIDNSHPES